MALDTYTQTHRGQTTKWNCVNKNDKQNTKNYGCSHSTSTLLYAVAMESRMIHTHTGPVTNTLERLFSLIDSNFCAMIDKKKRECWLLIDLYLIQLIFTNAIYSNKSAALVSGWIVKVNRRNSTVIFDRRHVQRALHHFGRIHRSSDMYSHCHAIHFAWMRC